MPKIIFKELTLEPPKSRTRGFGFDAACDEFLAGAGFFQLEQLLVSCVRVGRGAA
jgi:hypothetical protein